MSGAKATGALLMLAAHLSGAGELRAQEGLDDLLAEDRAFLEAAGTVVTAARYAQRVDRTPSNVYVIDRERLDALRPRTVADALSQVPGFTVLRRGQRAHQLSAFGVGGQFSNKILVLLDGHRVTEPGFGNVLWHELPVVMEDVERIEVVLGPESTLYGNNAFAAVVNVITGRYRGKERQRLVLSRGNRGYDRSSYLFASGDQDSHVTAVFQSEHQGGFGPLEDTAGRPDAAFLQGEGLGRRLARVTHSATLPHDTRLRFSFSHVDVELAAIPVAPTQQTEISGQEEVDGLHFDLSRAFSLDSSIELRGTYMNTSRQTDPAPAPHLGIADDRLDSGLLDLELRWNRTAGHWRLASGLGFRHIESTGYLQGPGDADADSRAIFMQGERELGEKLVLFLGARAVFQDLASDEVSWKLAGLYRPRSDVGIRLSVGTSFRQPDLVAARLRTINTLNGFPTDQPFLQGNPRLDNEVAKEFVQAGYERRHRRGSWKLDVYTARLERQIRLRPVGPPIDLLTPTPVATDVYPQQYVNLSSPLRVRGSTLAVEQDLGGWRLSLGLNVQDVSGDPTFADAPYAPSRSGTLTLYRPPEDRRWGGSLSLTGVGSYDVDENALSDGAPRQLPGWGVVDLEVERRVSPSTSVSFSVRNLLDNRHQEVLYTLIGDTREQGVVFGREAWVTVRFDL